MNEHTTQIELYDLEKIEQKAFTSIFQDGIFDILLGFILVAYSFSSYLFDSLQSMWRITISFVIYFTGIIGLFLCRQYITQPRMGVVKFGLKRRMKQKIILIITVIIVTISLVVMILAMTNTFNLGNLGFGTAAIFGGCILLFFIALAFMLNFKRLYLIGSLFALAIGLNEVFITLNMEIYGYISQWILGTIIMAIGTTYFVIFLKKHPKKMRENNEQ